MFVHYHMFIVVCMLIASSLLLAHTAPPALPVSPYATLALPPALGHLSVTRSGSLLFCMVCAYRSSGAFQEFVCATNMQPGYFTEGFEVFESLVVSVFPWLHACFSVLFCFLCFFGGDELYLFQFTVVLHRKVEMGSLPSCW